VPELPSCCVKHSLNICILSHRLLIYLNLDALSFAILLWRFPEASDLISRNPCPDASEQY